MLDGYMYAPSDQPYLVEIWIEKSTMDDVLLPLCEELHINLVTSAGFQSITSAVMDAVLQAELAPLQERVQRLRHAVDVAMRRFRPALPTCLEADTAPVDEEAWLFD